MDAHEIEQRTHHLMKHYQNAQELFGKGKKIDAHLLMIECVGIIKKNLAMLEAEERNKYIKKHKITEMLDFVKRLNQ